MRLLLITVHRLLLIITLLYGLSIGLLALLWHNEIRYRWWLELSNIFAPYLFLPLLLLIPLAILLPSRLFRSTVVGIVIVFLVICGPWFVPSGADTPPGGRQLRVLTFNVLYTNQQTDAIIETLRMHDADVIGFQELTSPVASVIEQELGHVYPYRLFESPSGTWDIGMMSRYPIIAVEPARGQRWQQVRLDVEGQPVTFINVHLAQPHLELRALPIIHKSVIIRNYNTEYRMQGILPLLDVVDAVQEPLIMLGDFNMSDREQVYSMFAHRLHDAHARTAWGSGATFPTREKRIRRVPIPFPLVRIDYVWSGNGVVPISSTTRCDSAGSDHCLIVADLSLSDRSP